MINYILFGLLSLFWGGSFVAIKYLIEEVPSSTAAFYRVFFSILFLVIIYFKALKLPKGFFGKELFYCVICGICSMGIPFSLLFWGEKYISPSMAGVLNGTVPFWTLIISVLFFNGIKQVTKTKVLGLFVGLCGILFIFGPKITMSGDPNEIMGLAAVLGMALFYSIGINLTDKLLAKNKIIVKKLNTIIQQIAAGFYLIILALIVDGVPDLGLLTKPQNSLSILYLSLISTCLAFIFFYRLIEVFGPVKASTVTYFVPPIALSLDAIIYGRILGLYEAIGSLIIMLSMYLLKERKIIKGNKDIKKLDSATV
jgi:drug/metabolite transporter (DMT)-like permease